MPVTILLIHQVRSSKVKIKGGNLKENQGGKKATIEISIYLWIHGKYWQEEECRSFSGMNNFYRPNSLTG